MIDFSQVDKLKPRQLARLLDVGSDAAWLAEESAEILRHQLAAPLLPDIAQSPGAEAGRLKRWVNGCGNAATFGEQLTGQRSNPELLRAIKDFAKHARNEETSPLRGAPAMVLYYAAIAAALARCGQRITQLSDAELREGISWCMQQAGAESLAEIFAETLSVLK
jgi:hypothetical protein